MTNQLLDKLTINIKTIKLLSKSTVNVNNPKTTIHHKARAMYLSDKVQDRF